MTKHFGDTTMGELIGRAILLLVLFSPIIAIIIKMPK
jgi:hypothetical protein